jgi:hypothetical protein
MTPPPAVVAAMARVLGACSAPGAATWCGLMGWGAPPPGACGWLAGEPCLPGEAAMWPTMGARAVSMEYDASGTRVGLVSTQPDTLGTWTLGSRGLLASSEGARRLRAGDVGRAAIVVGAPWQWLRAVCGLEGQGVAVYGVATMIARRELAPLAGRSPVVLAASSGAHLRALGQSVCDRVGVPAPVAYWRPVGEWLADSGG